MAIVLRDRAALFVDGRYTLQAAAQVDPALFEIRHLIDEPPAQLARRGARQAAPCSATTPGCTRRRRSSGCRPAAERAGASLRAVDGNPLDRVWPGRPAAPLAPVVPHPDRFAGESAAAKRARLGRGARRGRASPPRC